MYARLYAMAISLKEMSTADLCCFLDEAGVHEDVTRSFTQNRINGLGFLSLTEDDLKELVPVIGDRICIRRLKDKFEKELEQRQQSQGSNPGERAVINVGHSIGSGNDEVDAVDSSHSSELTELAVIPSQQPAGNWHLSFKIPEKGFFSGTVNKAISTGVVTSKARHEIVQVLRTLMMMHTVYPTSEQYVTVCKELIAKFPKLADEVGTNGFGSWRLSLRSAFKNFRRDYPKDENKPSPKKKKMNDSECTDESNEEEYEEAIKELQAEHAKGKKGGKNHSKIKELMEKTGAKRQRWIHDTNPLIADVIELFPILSTTKGLHREFKSILSYTETVSSLMNSWPEWKEKLIKLSKLESKTRPNIKKIIDVLENEDNNESEDFGDYCCLDLLLKLLFPRGHKNKEVFLKHYENVDVELENEVMDMQSAPFIVLTGLHDDSTIQYFICVEQTIYVEVKRLTDAIIDLIATYFVFNISYPRSISPVLIFFQHFVFGLTDKQGVPTATVKLVGSLQNI